MNLKCLPKSMMHLVEEKYSINCKYYYNLKLDKKVCEQTLSWLAKAGPESFKKFGKF